MDKNEIEILLRQHLGGVREALDAHLDGIERALADSIERMNGSVEDRLSGIERRLAILEDAASDGR